MLTIELKFVAGRYHATPWGRHVNEADVAWPPDAWRVIRALIATWHRKLDKDRYPETLLSSLVERLAESLPRYHLPGAVHTHTRHYMPIRSGKAEKPILVYDAFARIAASEPIIMAWPDLSLGREEQALLDELLTCMGYLGRAESWLEARRLEQWEGKFNCVPGDQALDAETGELREIVRCLAPLSNAEYRALRANQLAAQDQRGQTRLAKTLPESLLDALRLETADLQKAGWSQPPAAQSICYLRELNSLKPQSFPKTKVTSCTHDTARFMLIGKPLPRIENAVKVGEWMRLAVLSKAKGVFGENAIPACLSGHGLPKGNRHQHAFFLPEDADDDGHIDHIWVHVPQGLSHDSRRALGRLTHLKGRDGGEWQLVLETTAQREQFADAAPVGTAGCWVSTTPYLHPWHLKKKLTVEDQIRRECRARGIPEPETMEQLPEITIHGKSRRAIHFHRFRSKRGLTQPDTHGSFWRLTFAKPVQGPLALGFGCHFGLGLFKPI